MNKEKSALHSEYKLSVYYISFLQLILNNYLKIIVKLLMKLLI